MKSLQVRKNLRVVQIIRRDLIKRKVKNINHIGKDQGVIIEEREAELDLVPMIYKNKSTIIENTLITILKNMILNMIMTKRKNTRSIEDIEVLIYFL